MCTHNQPSHAWRDWIEELDVTLLALDDCALECDGLTAAVSFALTRAGVSHRPRCGFAKDLSTGDVVMPHCWIELSGDWIVDYRLRMWLGDHDRVPHGVFLRSASGFEYRGHPLNLAWQSPEIVELLTEGQLSSVRIPPPPEVPHVFF